MKFTEIVKKSFVALVAAFALTVGASIASAKPSALASLTPTEKAVRHELLMLPYYGVFDNLDFKVNGDTVTLYGQVVRPTTRTDAAARVAKLPGVARVVNNIEVLPLSSFDDQIRLRAYRTIFSAGGLSRYAAGVNPSVHIIVNNGHLTLEGVVDNNADRNLANIVANGIPGVFSVTNNLRVEGAR